MGVAGRARAGLIKVSQGARRSFWAGWSGSGGGRERLLDGLYVAIPAFGGEWEWGWWRRAGRSNKGFARRPQEFLSWEEWEWEWCVE